VVYRRPHRIETTHTVQHQMPDGTVSIVPVTLIHYDDGCCDVKTHDGTNLTDEEAAEAITDRGTSYAQLEAVHRAEYYDHKYHEWCDEKSLRSKQHGEIYPIYVAGVRPQHSNAC